MQQKTPSGTGKRYQLGGRPVRKIGGKVVQEEEVYLITFPEASKVAKYWYRFDVERDNGEITRLNLNSKKKIYKQKHGGDSYYVDTGITSRVREILKDELGSNVVVSE